MYEPELTISALFSSAPPMAADAVHRLAALERLANVSPHSDDWEAELGAITLGFLDAILEADTDALADAADPLRDNLASLFGEEGHAAEIRGWVLGLLALTRWALERLPSIDELALTRSSHASQFLNALASDKARGSSELRACLHTSDSQVSRVGRDLLARGLVVQRRLGREAVWELTPRGKVLLRKAGEADAQTPARHAHAAARHQTPARGYQNGSGNRNGGHSASAAKRQHRMLKQKAAEVRHVVPAEGGWRIVKDPASGRGERLRAKNDAIARAKEIVGNAGGGVIQTYDKTGKPTGRTSVPPASRES